MGAANIGAKMLVVFGHMNGAGPFLQGFRKIVSGCSRGASQDELVMNIAISCLRAARLGA